MAIDTAAKRNAALLRLSGVLLPDGTIDAADRQTLVGDYALAGGLSTEAPTPPGPGGHGLPLVGVGG
jgi:hypothetical protein